MKFFHVYNERCFEGLVKNNLINEDTGFKIQHCFAVPEKLKFNTFAAKGTKLHSMIKNDKIPFYVDRLAGGITYHNYKFDHELIREYEKILGEWFLGFQLHESASNRLDSDWSPLYDAFGKGPYSKTLIDEKMKSSFAALEDGTLLHTLSQGSPDEYDKKMFPETHEAFFEDMRELYKKRMDETLGYILPCDSYYLMTKLQNDVGVKTFMPEVGWQIGQMRIAVSHARAIAEAANKLWGTYYETWFVTKGSNIASMPCFNNDPSNEWYLTQDKHPDDFTNHGPGGGSSRLLQKRIYYYSLMSGADYLAEEWGLNCSYNDMNTFELSEYGLAKKEFIDFARNHKGIKAKIPFAVVLPADYLSININSPFEPYVFGEPREAFYRRYVLEGSKKTLFDHAENVLKFIYETNGESFGNEGHVMTNSRFGDLFDIIYEDAGDEVLSKYDCLIDASSDSRFYNKNRSKYRVMESLDFEKLEHDIKELSKELLDVTVDSLHWILSRGANGERYLSIFNNEGNYRERPEGDHIIAQANRRVKISFKEPCVLKPFKCGCENVKIEKADDRTYYVDIPAAQFALFEY